MKHINTKWLLQTITCLFTALVITASPAAARNGEPSQQKADFELKQVDKNKVLITSNMVAQGTEYYEIERSENNKDFTTVCVVFPAGANEAMRNGIALKDKVNTTSHTFYYRLKKVTGTTIEYSAAKTIQLQ